MIGVGDDQEHTSVLIMAVSSFGESLR